MDELERFLHWFLTKGSSLGAVPLLNAVHKIEDVYSVTWYRQAPFQVQLFVVPPNYIIPEHTHPNVDSFEVYLGGQIKFSLHGKWVVSEDEFTGPTEFGLSKIRGHTIRVKPDSVHGGIFGPAGGVFMSVQHWLNGVEPHCVSRDYDGIVMGESHAKSVVCGCPIVKDKLTATDAAAMEVA